jgi:hypothetical protein
MNFKRLFLAGLFAAVLAGGGYAFAASANVASDDLSAGTAVTAACQATALTVTYPAAGLSYDAAVPGYTVAEVSLTGVTAGCAGKSAKLELTGAADVSLGEATATLALGANTFTYVTPVSASAVSGVALVIA